ncbi:MAG: hypothetical protein AB7H90_05970 [Alphaproteobacteria bacterium]
MIWRDVYVAAEVGEAQLREHLAGVFGVTPNRVSVVPNETDMPPLDSYPVVGVIRRREGEYPYMLSIYLFGDQDTLNNLDENSLLQALAMHIGCSILAPANDPDPYRFVRFSPVGPVEEVGVEPNALDEHGAIKFEGKRRSWPDRI